ncbi:MAG: cupin domain-containing protein [Chloroflexi bacterium]|nr:cupin domain-containing protein [Chloroflexota bacterium]
MERPTVTQSTEVAAIIAPGQGLSLADGDVQALLKAGGELTAGMYTILECTLAPGKSGPPLHRHILTYEILQVLEGQLTVTMGGRTVTAGAGAMAFVPLGVAHTHANASNIPVRFLSITAPAGYDAYLQELAKLQAQHGAPLPGDIAQELMERFDILPA